MTRCKRCGCWYEGLGCKPCANKACFEGMLAQQLLYMPGFLAGQLKVRVLTKEGRDHAALWGHYHRAFCGLDLTHAPLKTRRELGKLPPNMCGECYRAFATVEEASLASPQKMPIELLKD